jgi:hypothetical protein
LLRMGGWSSMASDLYSSFSNSAQWIAF